MNNLKMNDLMTRNAATLRYWLLTARKWRLAGDHAESWYWLARVAEARAAIRRECAQ